MAKAFVETTILADALLKAGSTRDTAKRALLRYEKTVMPVYAIKELQAGAMKNMVWLHNKFVITKSHAKTIEALQRMSRTPKRYTTSTALEALHAAAVRFSRTTPEGLAEKYGQRASMDQVMCDRYRLSIQANVLLAWKKRRKMVNDIVYPLPCYEEIGPREERGLLVIDPINCTPNAKCEIARLLKAGPDELKKLKDVVESQPSKPENRSRYQALRSLVRTPKRELSHADCRSLGDAVFAFLSPPDCVILTTNTRDLEPLASAIGKRTVRPDASD